MSYFITILLGTFVLEDVALATAMTLVAKNQISLANAFLACFIGISIGDIGLFFIGAGARQLKVDLNINRFQRMKARFSKRPSQAWLTYTVIVSRFLPGTRVPTYLAAGAFGYSFLAFTSLTILTVFVWVAMAFVVGRSLSSLIANNWILTLICVVVGLQALKFFLTLCTDPWKRKAWLQSWRKWQSFEFWPGSVFYLPIVPYYIWLSLRYRSLLIPFYANPTMKHGGLIGESKWDYLQYLKPPSRGVLRAIRIPRGVGFAALQALLKSGGFDYPFVIKPDVGQRGFGVRIIRSDSDLVEYLDLADFDVIVQDHSVFAHEAGVFYVRRPSEKRGCILSITDKEFPAVKGDGKSQLGKLILNDRRARILASVYFARHREKLDFILQADQVFKLSECGNHCQGAIFRDGFRLKTEQLESEIDRIARQIPHFYFGRFDLRYENAESLMAGTGFEIVEVNGAGAEATHIWDPQVSFFTAYRDLFKQWRLLFEVGAMARQQGLRPTIKLGPFLKECYRVYFRKQSLSVSD